MSGYVAIAAAVGAAIAAGLALLRLFAGPTLYDRAMAANAVAAKAGVICAAVAVVAGRAAWIDAAFALVLGVFVTNVAIVKFFRAGTFQPPLGRAQEEA